MGYLKANSQDTDQLFLPSAATEWEELTDKKGNAVRGKPLAGEYHVQIKKRAAYGDRLAVQSSAVVVSMAGTEVTPTVDSAASVRMGIVRLVTGWNLTDEADQPIPITVENIERLDPEDGEFLAKEANERLEVRSADQQNPSSNGSGRPSTGTRSRTK